MYVHSVRSHNMHAHNDFINIAFVAWIFYKIFNRFHLSLIIAHIPMKMFWEKKMIRILLFVNWLFISMHTLICVLMEHRIYITWTIMLLMMINNHQLIDFPCWKLTHIHTLFSIRCNPKPKLRFVTVRFNLAVMLIWFAAFFVAAIKQLKQNSWLNFAEIIAKQILKFGIYSFCFSPRMKWSNMRKKSSSMCRINIDFLFLSSVWFYSKRIYSPISERIKRQRKLHVLCIFRTKTFFI